MTSPIDKSWKDLLEENGGSSFRATQNHFLLTGKIHPGISNDHLQEIFDGAKMGSEFEKALKFELKNRRS